MFVPNRVLLLLASLAWLGGLIRAAETEETTAHTGGDPSVVYSEEENFRYINQVLAKLNNNEECILPSWDEVDELQRSYAQLEAALGGAEQLRAKLDTDQRRVQDTLLDQWTVFQQRMTAGVVIMSSKKRAFLGKIEKYQESKYGSSVCTRFMDNSNVTKQIFIKNPIARYVAHIQTHHEYVPEPEAEHKDRKREEEEPVPEPEPEPKPEPQPEDKHKVIEVPIPDGPLNLSIEYIPMNGVDSDDPLVDIPAPPADDKKDEPKPEPQNKPEPEPAPESETKVEDHNPNAPEMVEIKEDNEDLIRLDKPEPKEWDFDYANGELKWPDEESGVKFDESDDQVKREWSNFLEYPNFCVRADGSLYDCTEDRHNLPSRPGAEQRRRQFVQSVKIHMDQKQVEAMVGWHPDRWDPEVERRVRVPPGQREPPQGQRESPKENNHGWSRFYTGRFCRISVNKKNINDSRGVRAVKTLFGRDEQSKKKKKMLAKQRAEL